MPGERLAQKKERSILHPAADLKELICDMDEIRLLVVEVAQLLCDLRSLLGDSIRQ